MKNIIFLFWTAVIILLLSPQNVVAQPEYQLDRTEVYLWEDPNWILQGRTQYTYDDPDADFTNSLSEIYLEIDNELVWRPWHQITRIYNNDNTLNTEILQDHGIFFHDDTKPNYKTEYEYDSHGNNIKVTRYCANDIGGWTKTGQDVLLYDNGLNTEVITYEWDDTWKEFKKTEKNYNSENWIIKQEDFNWEDTHWALTPQSTTDYTYYPNGLLKNETKRNGGSLVNNARTEYLYDNDKLSLESHYAWNYPNGPWILLGDLQYSYQSNGQLKEVIDNEYGWFKIKTVYFWNTLGVSSNELVKGKAYPNPFTDVLNISLKVSLERQGTLYIFDSMGKELSKINLNQGVKTITIHNLDFLKGIYFIKISSGVYNQTFKVIKQ